MKLQSLKTLTRELLSWIERRVNYLVFLRIQVVIALITLFLFTTNQAKEVLSAMVEDGRWVKMIFTSLLTFSLSLLIWHTARALSLRRKGKIAALTNLTGRSPWMPRILGLIPLLTLICQLLQIKQEGHYWILWFGGTLILLLFLFSILWIRTNFSRFPFISGSTPGEGIFSKELEIFFFFSAWAGFAFFAIPNSILLAKNDVNSGVIAVVATMATLIFAQWVLLSWAKPQHHKYIWWGMLLALSPIAISVSAVRGGKALLIWPQRIGSLSMVLMALIAVLVISSTIYRWAIYERIPVITPLLIFIFGINVFGFNDNRSIRTLLPSTGGREHSFKDYFDTWKKQRFDKWKPCNDKRKCPIYIVAAQGGGIYAAYHAGRVLSVLNEETKGAFEDHLFAISGVSGGSVGSASFLAINNISNVSKPGAPDDPQELRLKTRLVGHHLQSDLLSPLLSVALYGDSLQSLLPIPISVWDRALGLELALESNVQNIEENELSRYLGGPEPQKPVEIKKMVKDISNQIETFMERPLNTPPNSNYFPALVVNTTVVENGQRLLIAPFSTDEIAGVNLDSTDLIRFSTAAVLSARFPFITSYGTTKTKDSAEKIKLVDGGYFDNSGLVTAHQIRDLIHQYQKSDQERDAYPVIIIALTDLNEVTSKVQIFGSINRTHDEYQSKKQGTNILDQLNMTPLSALWRTRESRTKQIFANIRPNETNEVYVLPLLKEIQIKKNNIKIALPLGWKLSKRSADFIDSQIPRTNEEKSNRYDEDKNFMYVKTRFLNVRNKIRADLAPPPR